MVVCDERRYDHRYRDAKWIPTFEQNTAKQFPFLPIAKRRRELGAQEVVIAFVLCVLDIYENLSLSRFVVVFHHLPAFSSFVSLNRRHRHCHRRRRPTPSF